jgi:hypothetical protein
MDFSVEAKYPIKIFQNNDLDCSWVTIQVGWDLKRLDLHEVSKFAIYFLEMHPNIINEWISEFIFEVKDYEVEELLRNIFKSLKLDFPIKQSSLWNQEWRKWRYCIMSEMVKQILDIQELLVRVEGVYADFGYPQDMEHLIYYMPSNEANNQGLEEACINLVKKINVFLQEERERIDKGCDTLPRISYIGEDDVL